MSPSLQTEISHRDGNHRGRTASYPTAPHIPHTSRTVALLCSACQVTLTVGPPHSRTAATPSPRNLRAANVRRSHRPGCWTAIPNTQSSDCACRMLRGLVTATTRCPLRVESIRGWVENLISGRTAQYGRKMWCLSRSEMLNSASEGHYQEMNSLPIGHRYHSHIVEEGLYVSSTPQANVTVQVGRILHRGHQCIIHVHIDAGTTKL